MKSFWGPTDIFHKISHQRSYYILSSTDQESLGITFLSFKTQSFVRPSQVISNLSRFHTLSSSTAHWCTILLRRFHSCWALKAFWCWLRWWITRLLSWKKCNDTHNDSWRSIKWKTSAVYSGICCLCFSFAFPIIILELFCQRLKPNPLLRKWSFCGSGSPAFRLLEISPR